MTVHASPGRIDTFIAGLEAWHRTVEARLADPHGFLAITNLFVEQFENGPPTTPPVLELNQPVQKSPLADRSDP